MSNYTDLPITVSAAEGKARLWRNTSLATLASGSSAQLAPHTVGYESDEDLDNGFRPEGLIRLSTTTGPVDQYLQDFGNTSETRHHHPQHDHVPRSQRGPRLLGRHRPVDVGPGRGPRRRRRPRRSADAAGANQPVGGHGSPTGHPGHGAGGGDSQQRHGRAHRDRSLPGRGRHHSARHQRHGVRNGKRHRRHRGRSRSLHRRRQHWHPAQGKQSWSYTYIQKGLATASIKVRAVDDSANIGTPVTRNLQLTGPYTVFGQQVPAVPDSQDGGGLRARHDHQAQRGRLHHRGALLQEHCQYRNPHRFAVEFHRPTAGDRHVHLGNGVRVAEGPFSQPVAVTAGQKYTVSYTAPNGHYASKDYQWASFGFTDPPLTVSGGFGSQPAGVYGSPGSFPENSFANGNYFVDAVFDTVDNTPLTASGQWPLDGSSSVPQTTTVGAVFSKPVTASSAQLTVTAHGTAVAGTTGYDSTTRKVTFTPAAEPRSRHHLYGYLERHSDERRFPDRQQYVVLHHRGLTAAHRGPAPAASTMTPSSRESRRFVTGYH